MALNIAIVLVHNKSDQENYQQIENLKSLINKVVDINDQFNENGTRIGTFATYHYELKGINIPHTVKIYQILPFQPNNPIKPYEGIWPDNVHDLDSHKVSYGWGDEDKTGDHPRFFNWGLKRGTDYGADLVIHVEDSSKLDFKKLLPDLQKIKDPTDKTEFLDKPELKVASLKLLMHVGQLNETKDKSIAIDDFKIRILQKGLIHG